MTPMRVWGLGATAFVAIALLGAPAQAHFILQAPDAMTNQSVLGDPQKQAPCGDNSGTMLSGATTAFEAGETITIQIDETVTHPGHYRVALSLGDPAELPPAPPVMQVGMDECASTTIMDPPVFPVLADGELQHTEGFGAPQTFQVTLPDDVECEACLLQVIEYMSSHAAPCFYYHCAEISISPSAAATSNGDDTSGESGPGSTSNGDDTSNADTNGDGSDPTNASNDDNGDDGTTSAASASDTNATATDTDTSTGPEQTGDEGCGCRTTGTGPTAALFTLLLLTTRRRGF